MQYNDRNSMILHDLIKYFPYKELKSKMIYERVIELILTHPFLVDETHHPKWVVARGKNRKPKGEKVPKWLKSYVQDHISYVNLKR